MNKGYCMIFLFTFMSCERKLDISGHWVSVPDEHYDGSSYRTIDIMDSLLIMDRGSLTQTYGIDTFIVRQIYLDSLPYFEGREKLANLFDVYWPGYTPIRNYRRLSDEFGDSIVTNLDDGMLGDDPEIAYAPQPQIDLFDFVVTVRNDTLIAEGDIFPANYFVQDEPNFESDLFADLNVDIELLRHKGQSCELRTDLIWINIGRSKLRAQSDSFKIQVNDVFIDAIVIPQFLEIEKDKYELKEKEKFSVVLPIDRNAPRELVEEVVRSIHNYDPRIEIIFPVINLQEEVCLIDSVRFFALLLEQ